MVSSRRLECPPRRQEISSSSIQDHFEFYFLSGPAGIGGSAPAFAMLALNVAGLLGGYVLAGQAAGKRGYFMVACVSAWGFHAARNALCGVESFHCGGSYGALRRCGVEDLHDRTRRQDRLACACSAPCERLVGDPSPRLSRHGHCASPDRRDRCWHRHTSSTIPCPLGNRFSGGDTHGAPTHF